MSDAGKLCATTVLAALTLLNAGCKSSITKDERNLSQIVQRLNTTAGKLSQDEADVRNFVDSKSSPVKVRGGAMTFITKNSWSPVNGHRHTYCTKTQSSGVEAEGFGVLADGSIPNLPQKWTLQVVGGSGSNGIQMQSDTKDCGGNAGFSVTISPIQSGDFYPNDLTLPSRKQNKRFLDKSCGDEDACERMTSLKIVSSGITYSCLDLDCSLYIGAP